MTAIKRVIIYGAGAIGSVVGGYLSMAGYEVVLIGRPGHVTAIESSGLKLVTPDGSRFIKVSAITSPADIKFGDGDVVFLCMKAQDTAEAINELHGLTDKCQPVFCFQNGVGNEDLALEHFDNVYGVSVMMPSYYLKDGEVSVIWHPPGSIIIGRYPTGSDELVNEVALRLRFSGFMVMVSPQIVPYKWGKLIANLANSVIAITGLGRWDNEAIIQAAQQEAEEILTPSGIEWISRAQVQKLWPEGAIKPSESVEAPGRSSTWQSLVRRQGTVETDFLNGEIVHLAGKLGRKAPINEKLLDITLEMAGRKELPGRYTPDQLEKLLGL
jgi:2-dehydropantoate 2-reductase